MKKCSSLSIIEDLQLLRYVSIKASHQFLVLGTEETVVKICVYYSYLWIYDLYGSISNAFDAGKSAKRARGVGWALEIKTFLGPVKWH
jgi:hypothetical protein